MSLLSQEFNVISVDVGTTSVRLAIINFHGEDYKQAKVLASQDKDIEYFQDGDKYEQNSEQIFAAICECSKACIKRAKIELSSIKSIGFSATCSLVIHNEKDRSNDVIMWMDHRAIDEAQTITVSGSSVLRQFGGVCSPEFSLSKLVWLKHNEPKRLEAASGLFELPDWLVYRCIGGDVGQCPRSLCSLTCKWGYDSDSNCHCDIISSLFGPDLEQKIGLKVLKPGLVAGYLSVKTAEELGLVDHLHDVGNDLAESKTRTSIVVGTSLIDAHAGMLAMLSIPLDEYCSKMAVETTFCSLAGTSSCHMLLSKGYNYTKGVWGPYKNVVLDEFYLLEAGQSLTGKLVEICIERSIEGKQMLDSGVSMKTIIQDLNKQINVAEAKSNLLVLPTYHGNRSPLANPRLRGGVYGLSAQGQCLLDNYIAHIEAIVFETKLVVETLGIELTSILVSGGLMKNKFYMQTLANVLNCQAVKISLQNVDVMVMGSALVARCAAINSMHVDVVATSPKGHQQPLTEQNVHGLKYEQLDIETYQPSSNLSEYLNQKYLCYKEFVQFSQRLDKMLYKDNK